MISGNTTPDNNHTNIPLSLEIKSNYSTNEILHALKIFSTIEENDRIFTHNTSIYIMAGSQHLQWFWRWLYEEDRLKNITYVSNIIMHAFTIAESRLQEREGLLITRLEHKSINQQHNIHVLQNERSLVRMKKNIQEIIPGLCNLKKTYSTDAAVCAHLDILVENITDFFDVFDASLSYLKSKID
jgi:hypothetical protein